MLAPKSIHSIIDYRNGRYQGTIDDEGNRHQLGVLIDDDLSFYVSHWNNNVLNGQTLVYISHGKYIYGQWSNNQPNGINVFRTGDTVLLGQFLNGKIVGKILVIFERYNIIAVLQSNSQQNKFQVLQSGKLLSHDDLIKYISFLDIQMPDHYFSLIKFVTSLTTSDQNQDDYPLISLPCQGQNCYFGYRDGLAIVFNSNNGVVSVGHHQNKKLTVYGGKFDGSKIEQGNFDLNKTILYNKKRPSQQIYTIFQKMHKRSLNYKNQYFDSKVKTLGNLQQLLRGNIQKIVSFNIKNKIHSATANDLNDSLDYQNLNNYQSQKTSKNRQIMYQKQSLNMKKTISKYCKDQNQDKSERSIKKSSILQSGHKGKSKVQNIQHSPKRDSQTVRKTPQKQSESAVCYAKKSPIRYRQQEEEIYYPQLSNNYKDKDLQEQIKNQHRNNKAYERSQRKKDKSLCNYQKKNILNRETQSSVSKNKIPRFGGLEVEDSQNNNIHQKSRVQVQVQDYKRYLELSKSKEKRQGQQIGKYLKRPCYQDIQQRRKRILNQFKQLSSLPTSNSNSRFSNISQKRKASHKVSLQIQINQNSEHNLKKNVAQSPCMKEKLLSQASQNDNGTENSQEGYMPLSLINHDRNKVNRRDANEIRGSNKSAFTKKESIIEKLQSSNSKFGKENHSYTPSYLRQKYQGDIQNLNLERSTKQKNNLTKRFSCFNQQVKLQQTKLSKKCISSHITSRNEENEQNKFSQIELKYKKSQKQSKMRQNQRSYSPLTTDVSRSKKCYKYYFEQ